VSVGHGFVKCGVFCGSLVSEGKMVRAPSRMPTLTTMKPSRSWDTQVVKIWATRPTNQGNEVNLYSAVTLFAKFSEMVYVAAAVDGDVVDEELERVRPGPPARMRFAIASQSVPDTVLPGMHRRRITPRRR
jgi:hypothetical protein